MKTREGHKMIHSCLLCLTLGLAAPSLAAEPPHQTASPPTRLGSLQAKGPMSLSLEIVYRRVFPDRVTILEPRFPGDSLTEKTTYVTYSRGRLEARDSQTGRSSWSTAIRCTAEPILLRADNDYHLFASKHHFFAVSTALGHQLWQLGEPAPDDPNVDPESLSTITEIEMRADHLYAIWDHGEVCCVDVPSGRILWRIPVERGSVQRLLPDANVLYISSTTPRKETVVLAVATRSGTLRQKHTLPRINGDIITPHALLPGKDGTFLITTPNIVAAIAKDTGQSRWKIGSSIPFQLPSITATGESLFFGSITNTIARHRLRDGERVWSTDEVGQHPNNSKWITVADDGVFIATSDTLAAINRRDGRCRWIVRNPHGLDCYPPVMAPHAIFTITPEKGDSRTHDEATPTRTRYQIRGLDRATGTDLLQPTITEPLESFSGMVIRGNILIILDATRTIGYVSHGAAVWRKKPTTAGQHP